MTNYMLIQSEEPQATERTINLYQLAKDLTCAGHSVSLFLVQNAVIPARTTSKYQYFDELLEHDLRILVDSFSLLQREIYVGDVKRNIEIGSVRDVIEAMLDGDRVIWN